MEKDEKFKIARQEIIDAAMSNKAYGCSSVGWKIGEEAGSQVIVVVTNDPDMIETVC